MIMIKPGLRLVFILLAFICTTILCAPSASGSVFTAGDYLSWDNKVRLTIEIKDDLTIFRIDGNELSCSSCSKKEKFKIPKSQWANSTHFSYQDKVFAPKVIIELRGEDVIITRVPGKVTRNMIDYRQFYWEKAEYVFSRIEVTNSEEYLLSNELQGFYSENETVGRYLIRKPGYKNIVRVGLVFMKTSLSSEVDAIIKSDGKGVKVYMSQGIWEISKSKLKSFSKSKALEIQDTKHGKKLIFKKFAEIRKEGTEAKKFWSGSVIDGQPEGPGLLVSMTENSRISIYDGILSNGEFNGKGSYINQTGIYSGTFRNGELKGEVSLWLKFPEHEVRYLDGKMENWQFVDDIEAKDKDRNLLFKMIRQEDETYEYELTESYKKRMELERRFRSFWGRVADVAAYYILNPPNCEDQGGCILSNGECCMGSLTNESASDCDCY